MLVVKQQNAFYEMKDKIKQNKKNIKQINKNMPYCKNKTIYDIKHHCP